MSSGPPPPGALSSASEYLAGREALHLERELRKGVEEAEKRTSAILESITDGLAAMDRDWRFTYVNSAWEFLSGKTRQELLGHTIWELFPEVRGTIFDREYRRAVAENISVSVEDYYSAGHRWLSVGVYPSGDGGLALYARDITERKQFEEALLASEERFRGYFELGLIGMAITSPTNGCVEVNDEICRILGYERSELLKLTWAELTHPDDLSADVANFQRVLSGEIDGYSIDKRWIRKDGGVIHTSMSVRCVRDADGSVDYFLALLQDITARKEVEEALVNARNSLEQRVAERTSQLLIANQELGIQVEERERAEDKYRLLFDSIDEGFCIIEMIFDESDKPIDYRYLEVNPSFEKQTGIKNPRGKRMREIAPQHEEHWFEIYGKIALTGQPALFENVAADLQRWYDVYAFRVGEPHERKVAVLFNDITERKRKDERLAENEWRFRLLIESIPHHVWSRRTDGSLGYWNQRLVDYTGLTEEELRTGGWAALHPGDVERVKAAWEKTFANGTTYEMEQRVRGRDGQYRRFVCRAVPVKDEHGRPVEWFGTNTDAEDRRQTEEALYLLQTELAHIGRVTTLGELAGSIAHEISQPLTAVVSNADASLRWLNQTPPNIDEARTALEDIVRQGIRASEVIIRISALMRKGPRLSLVMNVNHLIEEILILVRPQIQRRNVELRTELAADLPSIAGDAVQLQQVVLNLVLNAIQAMDGQEEHSKKLTLVSRREGPHDVVISVSDSGEGIAAHQLDQLFQPFFTTKPGGIGMGLAICRSIVEAHGGRIWATSNVNHGADFQFSLPGVGY
jgi:PAS domain S-box-containing protein